MVRYLVLHLSEGLSHNQGEVWLSPEELHSKSTESVGWPPLEGHCEDEAEEFNDAIDLPCRGDRTLDSLKRFTNSAKITLERCGVCDGEGDYSGEQILDETLAAHREWRLLD
ncbi:hypothetical protein NC652_029528 [Populus alba x Populus x berolinensis]|nr:hypothetical protein NC652_029528 [Populus alba x Populus x berolinensis]